MIELYSSEGTKYIWNSSADKIIDLTPSEIQMTKTKVHLMSDHTILNKVSGNNIQMVIGNMSTVKELTHTMMDVPCKCGGYANCQIGDVGHVIGSKKIIIKNVPHYYCEFCGTASYGTDVNVSDLLKEAYSKNLNEISYQ